MTSCIPPTNRHEARSLIEAAGFSISRVGRFWRAQDENGVLWSERSLLALHARLLPLQSKNWMAKVTDAVEGSLSARILKPENPDEITKWDTQTLHGQPWRNRLNDPSGEAADAVDYWTEEQIYRSSLDSGLRCDCEVEKRLEQGNYAHPRR